MEERTTYVHVDIDGTAWLAGRLHTSAEAGHERARFEPDKEWLRHPLRHHIDASLVLEPGPYKSGGVMPLFGALGDSAPDRWGRTLMRRTEPSNIMLLIRPLFCWQLPDRPAPRRGPWR